MPKGVYSHARKTLADRFWAKVDTQGDLFDCWRWTAAVDRKGYGTIRYGGRGSILAKAHRLSWELHFGEIPVGLHVLHRCDAPACVRPDHLFLGTNYQNIEDALAKGRRDYPRTAKGQWKGRSNAA
jgi:HNH endonuclease